VITSLNRTIKGLLAGTVLVSALSVQASAMTLDEAVRRTLADNPRIISARQTADQIDAEVDEAWGGYLPRVDFTAATGHERSNNPTTRGRGASDANTSYWRNEGRIVVSQMLFDGGRVSSLVGQQRERLSAAGHTLHETRENTALRAILSYMDVVRLNTLVELATENRNNHQAYLDKITEQARGGQVSRADIRQAAGRLALAESTLIDFSRQRDDARATFVAVVGEAPEGLAKPTFMAESELPTSLDDAIESALENNPAVVAERHNVRAASEAVRESKSAFLPRLDAELSGGRAHNLDGSRGDNNEVVGLVRMSYNLYAGGSDMARKRARIMRQGAANAELTQRQRQVRELTRQAWNTYTNTRARLTPLSDHVVAASQTRDAYKDQFDLGRRTLLDLLDSEIEVFNAKVSLTNAEYAYAFSKYELASLMGELCEKFDQN
jgi:adhesin transport system outer membrane protein